ncbi:hypothetical protein B0J12DRAFT_416208 [Macrophomina phaseolina]|uniref:NmrA-like domain-containing protein n=1 Tax=Macrophomina phaseolina TaxID=35725 RepID=A0ABQ8FUP8_9PEZI|nr:hypothetical protein B0J12DRAFT_416208 [Macrophomina phaseolina]
MVKVAVAGGSGNVARVVIDKILAKKQHEVTVLTRQPVLGPTVDEHGVRWLQVDYSDKPSLAKILRGIDVVLCFFLDLDYVSVVRNSKNLIDASIQAGVKRFAPSEWGSRVNRSLPHNAFKDEIREYLEDTNSGRMRLEYTIFQPGLFVNYFGYPHASPKHFPMSQPFVDLEHRRAIMVEDGNAAITLTTVQDMGAVVAEALDYEGVWPVDGGMRGTQVTVAEMVEMSRRLRGCYAGCMKVETVSLDDLRAGQLKTSWRPDISHPTVPKELKDTISERMFLFFLNSVAHGCWNVSDTWNKLLPHYHFTTAEEYLSSIWAGKP